MATTVYLIYPEYEELSNGNPLIGTIGLEDKDYYEKALQRLNSFILNFNHEVFEGKYDSDNMRSFLSPCEMLPEEYPDIRREIRLALKQYEDCAKEKNGEIVVLLSPFKINLKGTIFGVIKKTVTDNPIDSFLILYDGSGSLRNNVIKFEGVSTGIQSHTMDIKDIYNWFCGNRSPKYVYKWNPKHGEFGRRAMPNKNEDVSLLLGSRQEAEKLMHYAIPVANHLKNNNEMFAYDPKYDKYMAYKYSNDGTFHSYHLKEEKENEIPNEVLKKMKTLGIDRKSQKNNG